MFFDSDLICHVIIKRDIIIVECHLLIHVFQKIVETVFLLNARNIAPEGNTFSPCIHEQP